MRRKVGTALAVLMAAVAIVALPMAGSTTVAADAHENATVTVKHRINGHAASQILLGDPFVLDKELPVDVYVDGVMAFTFSFPETVGPVEMPPGMYSVEVKLSGTDLTVIGPVMLTLEPGADVTVMAILRGVNGPTLIVS